MPPRPETHRLHAYPRFPPFFTAEGAPPSFPGGAGPPPRSAPPVQYKAFEGDTPFQEKPQAGAWDAVPSFGQ